MLIDDKVLDDLSARARGAVKLRYLVHLDEGPQAASQRMLHAMEPGVQMPIHRHVHMDQSYVLMRGCIRVFFYDDAGAVVNSFVLDPLQGCFALNIPRNTWHCLEVLATGSVLFECNDGPACDVPLEDILTLP